jgi:hypothetical protein
MCNCKQSEIIYGVVILLFTIWKTAASQALVVIAAILLIIHALRCKDIAACAAPASTGKAASGKRK